MAKVTKCDGCPEKGFDPATAKRGTLMLNYQGCLCIRTSVPWGEKGCEVYFFGLMGCGACSPYTLATGKYLLENDQ